MSPVTFFVEALTLTVAIFRDKTLKKKSLRLNNVLRVPLQKRKRHQGFRHREETCVRTPAEGGGLQAKEEDLRRHQSCQHLDLGLVSPEG